MKERNSNSLTIIASCILLSCSAYTYADENNRSTYSQEQVNEEETKDLDINFLHHQPDDFIKTLSLTEPGAQRIRASFYSESLPEGTIIKATNSKTGETHTYTPKEGYWETLTLSGDQLELTLYLPQQVSLKNEAKLKIVRLNYVPGASTTGRSIIGGKDERRRLACYKGTDMHAQGLSAVQLRMGKWGSGSSLGTDNLFLTNHHVANTSQEVANGEIWFNMHYSDCQGSDTLKTPIKISGEKLLVTGGNGTNDLTLFKADSFDVDYANIKRLFGGLQVSQANPKIGEPLYIPQHGNDGLQPTVIADRKSGSACKLLASDSSIRYNCDTQGGSSGSPVLSQNSHEIVGLHYAGDTSNYGVTLKTLWQYIKTFVNEKNNMAVKPVAHEVKGESLEISPFKSEGTIATYSTPVYFTSSDNRVTLQTQQNTSSKVFLQKKNMATGEVALDYKNGIELWLENSCGKHPIDQPANCATPGVTQLKYRADVTLDSNGSHKKAWLPLSEHKTYGQVTSEMVLRFSELSHDVFTPPFNVANATVHDLSFNGSAQSYTRTFSGSTTMGFLSFYPGQGPTSLIWTDDDIQPVPVFMRDSTTGHEQAVYFKLTKNVSNCLAHSMNSAISCASGSTSANLHVAYAPELNKSLPNGRYRGILPLQQREWKDKFDAKNVLLNLDLKKGDTETEYLPPVAVIKVDGSSELNANSPVKLTGSDSYNPNNTPIKTLKYSWSAASNADKVTFSSTNGATTSISLKQPASSDFSVLVKLQVTDAKGVIGETSQLLKTKSEGPGSCDVTDPEAGKYPAWSNSTIYLGGEVVAHNQLVWKAKWWTQGGAPGSNGASQWELLSKVQQNWDAARAYNGNDLVNHAGRQWKAKWWTLGNTPGSNDVWTDVGPASCNQ